MTCNWWLAWQLWVVSVAQLLPRLDGEVSFWIKAGISGLPDDIAWAQKCGHSMNKDTFGVKQIWSTNSYASGIIGIIGIIGILINGDFLNVGFTHLQWSLGEITGRS